MMDIGVKVLIGLMLPPLAAILYVTFLIAVYEIKRKRHGSEDIVVIVTAILLGICFPIEKYKRYVWNKYNKKG